MQRFGVVRTFVISVALFTIASLLCGLAWSLPSLIAFRVLQGFVAGPMMPLSQTLLMASYPRAQVGSALALWGMTTLVLRASRLSKAAPEKTLLWQTAIHITFLLSAMAIAATDRIMPQAARAKHGAPPAQAAPFFSGFSFSKLLGHSDVSTTMIYTHVLNKGGRGVASPLDAL